MTTRYITVGNDNSLPPAVMQKLEVQRSVALRPWFAALANRNISPAKVLVIGDSITEGQGATARDHRWLSRTRENIRARFPTIGVTGGGENYIPVMSVGPTFGTGWTLAGSPVRNDTLGMGLHAATLSTGKSATLTFTGDRVRVWYVKGNGVGDFTVAIDGGAAATVTGQNATTTDGNVWDSGALAPGSHTIVVAGSTTASSYVGGADFFNGDFAKGTNWYDGGHGGFRTGDFAGNTQHLGNYASINPRLVIIELGGNDYTASIASATVKTNLQTIITNVRAQCTVPPSFVLLPVYRFNAATYAEPWQNYVDKMHEIAAADTSVCVFDLTQRMAAPATDNTLGLVTGDLVHPSDIGHGFIGDALASFLTPR